MACLFKEIWEEVALNLIFNDISFIQWLQILNRINNIVFAMHSITHQLLSNRKIL